MSKTIVINRPLTESETDDVKLLIEEGAKVFALSSARSVEFAQIISLTSEEKRQVNYDMMDSVLQFGDLPVGDQTVADIFRRSEERRVWK